MNERYVITLVHGTWARHARWARPGSPLRTALQSQLDGPIRFRRLRWTGRNRQADRADAAARIRRRLSAGIDAHPDARHFVIAHSHGGNIVRAALQDPRLQRQVTGVITMGTPFIDCRRRDVSLQLRFLAVIVAVLAGYAVGAVAAQAAFAMVGRDAIDASSVARGLLGLGLLVVWPLVGRWVYRRLVPRLETSAARVADRSAARLVGTQSIATPFLCVGLDGDEASLGLGTAGWIADLPFRAAAGAGGMVQRSWRWVLWGVWVLMIPVSLAGMASLRIGAVALMGAALLAIPALTWPFAIVVPRIPWVAFGVGRERLADSLFSRVFTTRTPPRCDRCEVTYFSPRDVLGEGRLRALIGGRLLHSSVYETPAVAGHVASWMRRLLTDSTAY